MRKQFFGYLSLLIALSALIMSFTVSSGGRSFYKAVSDSPGPVAARAKDHKGVNVVSSRGAITFTTGLDNDYYQLDSVNRTGYLYLETKVGYYLNENAGKVPLNISIVIDRSGSMSGDKMSYAKKAAADIVNKLTADDYVSVIIYDDKVEVLQTQTPVTDKAFILSKIDKIVPGGSTNLWGGTEKGYAEVKSNYKKSFVNRVLLISDGLANVGITSNTEIRKLVQNYKDQEGVTLSTFGVGLDYNELLMTDMAEAGNGNYYFIESPDKMAALFDKELNGLLRVAAQNAELKIKLPRGVTVQKVFSYKYEQKGEELVIKFRDLFSEETKGVLIRFAIDDYANQPLKFISTLWYDDVADKQQQSLQNENNLNPDRNSEMYLTYFNKKVLEQTLLMVANENHERAMLEADKGNYEEARRINAANAGYMSANAAYLADSRELQAMDSVNAAYQFQLKTIEKLDQQSYKRVQKESRSLNYKVRAKKQ